MYVAILCCVHLSQRQIMYKGNHSPPNQHASLPHTLSVVSNVATVDCFPLTARIDELLLTETQVRYWSLDKTLPITENTSPHHLPRHAGFDRQKCQPLLRIWAFLTCNMPHSVGHLNRISVFVIVIPFRVCECQFGEEWLVNVDILNLFMNVVSCRGS